jgi:ubiquinol-cytochrome c reductase iron-sulfur subunit
METTMSTTVPPGDAEAPSRRDFIYILTGAAAVGGAAAVAWPLLDQMEPASNVLAQGSPVSVDLTKVPAGQQIVVLWRKNPMFVVHRTPASLAELQKPSTLDMLRDPDSEQMQQPAYAKNWSRAINPEWLVLVGVCTHLGCIPGYSPTVGSINATWPGGWLCPCHGSKYDLAGRVFKSVPAPLNLPVPPYHFPSPTSLIIGQNPPGDSFDLSQVQTL